MKISRALKVRDQAAQNIRSILRWAVSSKWTSSKLTEEYIRIKKELPKDTPTWVTSYLDGVMDTLRDQLQHSHIEFCYWLKGKLYSVRRESSRYYEKHGFKPSELTNKPNGLYWRDSDKEYFVDRKEESK